MTSEAIWTHRVFAGFQNLPINPIRWRPREGNKERTWSKKDDALVNSISTSKSMEDLSRWQIIIYIRFTHTPQKVWDITSYPSMIICKRGMNYNSRLIETDSSRKAFNLSNITPFSEISERRLIIVWAANVKAGTPDHSMINRMLAANLAAVHSTLLPCWIWADECGAQLGQLQCQCKRLQLEWSPQP